MLDECSVTTATPNGSTINNHLEHVDLLELLLGEGQRPVGGKVMGDLQVLREDKLQRRESMDRMNTKDQDKECRQSDTWILQQI